MNLKKSVLSAAIALAVVQTPLIAVDYGDGLIDVDIESLSGKLYHDGGRWLLEVRYDVEVEPRILHPGLELIVYVTEDGYELLDRSGNAMQFAVPLDRPTDVDHDDVDFESSFTVDLTEAVFSNPEHLRLHAVVLGEGDDRPLDTKEKSIKFKSGHSRAFGISVGLGVGCVSKRTYRYRPQRTQILHRRHQFRSRHNRMGVFLDIRPHKKGGRHRGGAYLDKRDYRRGGRRGGGACLDKRDRRRGGRRGGGAYLGKRNSIGGGHRDGGASFGKRHSIKGDHRRGKGSLGKRDDSRRGKRATSVGRRHNRSGRRR